jgi:hydroxyacylglutathione hydrolase
VAGSYITEDEDIYLLVNEHQVTEAIRDLYNIGLDRVKGYFTPRDLQMYKSQGGEMEDSWLVKRMFRPERNILCTV